MAANNSLKTSELPVANNIVATDRLVVVRNPDSTPSTVTVPLATLAANISMSNTVPANSTANGVAGTFAHDANFFYVCVANNVWTRAALSTF